ncbi:unnamed protein product, partial [Symbiodinium pilosum]
MPGEEAGSSSSGGQGSDDRSSGIWNLLPSFDPSADDPREYRDKVKFLHQICPIKDKGMLAPRLAMLCKGTAWAQVKTLDAAKLTDPDKGVDELLQALASWDEAAELQTYDKCEKALYRIHQKNDETTMSYVNRLAVAFHEMGEALTVKELKAFILLRQSALTSEDKRKVITLSGGTLDAARIEQAMRTLSTKVLTTGNEVKKRIYPANFVDTEDFEEVNVTEEDYDEDQMVAHLAETGDEDAIFVLDYEEQIALKSVMPNNSALTAADAKHQKNHGHKKGLSLEKSSTSAFWISFLLRMADQMNFLDLPLNMTEDDDLNTGYVTPLQTTRPTGVTSLRQWGTFQLDEGKFKGHLFME